MTGLSFGWAFRTTFLTPTSQALPCGGLFFFGCDDALLWTSISVELASTGVVGGAVLRRGGWFDPGLIHFSAETLH